MINMLHKLLDTELEYIRKFAEDHDDKEVIRFYDNNIPNMYTHNFTLIKDSICKEKFKKIILEELENRRNEKADFLRIEFNFPFHEDFIEDLPIIPQVTKYDYMYIAPRMREYLTIKEGCVIKEALSEKVLKDGIEVDILANQSGMGIEFAEKRIYRKAEVYKQLNSNLNLYVCYDNDIPIGNCELMLNNKVAKIEDFDIVSNYQRKGFGTSVLKHLLEEAEKQGAELGYLITESGDTAKEMYKKCGFKKAGEKTELFFNLS